MPVEVMLNYRESSSQWDWIRFQVVFQCAPVLKGVKVSNIITLPKGMWLHLFQVFWETKICCKLLYSGEKKEVILLYREKELAKILEKDSVQCFTKARGYTDIEIKGILKRLQVRYGAYARKEQDFPHELGIFLGYPLEDVEAFILNHGKNSLFTGYWKVYYNQEVALEVFRMYDQVRERATKDFMQHHNMRNIIC